MVHYAVRIDGVVIGSRSSKSHTEKVYTHAVVIDEGAGTWSVLSYHRTEQLARDMARTYGRTLSLTGAYYVKPVVTTARRAKVGDLVVPQGVL